MAWKCSARTDVDERHVHARHEVVVHKLLGPRVLLGYGLRAAEAHKASTTATCRGQYPCLVGAHGGPKLRSLAVFENMLAD
jgi:hypothetical protein